MECDSLAPAILSCCFTRVDSATATSKPSPETATAPVAVAPSFRKSRRVRFGTPSIPKFQPFKLTHSTPRCERKILGWPGPVGAPSASRDQEIAAVILVVRVAQQVGQARPPGPDHAGEADAVITRQRPRPRHPVIGQRRLDP